MSSPFRHFRKHSKAFMAAAAVMCMFLFVFASGTGGGRSSDGARDAGAKVATWNGGSMNQRELASYVHNRLVTDELLKRLFAQGGGQSLTEDLPRPLLDLLLRSQSPDYVEMDAIAVEVVSHLAAQSGMTVSDDMINTVLETFALKNVDADDMQGIFASLSGGDARTNETIVFNTLRKMLLAFFYRQGYQDAGYVVLPQERWEDWRRVNERISLEAAVLPVETFEKDVPPPTDVQIQALYNEFKDVEPHRWVTIDGRDMPSATPGFAEPRRVRLQFLLASVADRTEKQLASVTDAEIADYYERNKRSEFVKMDFGSDEEAPEEPQADPAAAETPAGEADEAAAAPADEAKPASEGQPQSAAEGQRGTPAAEGAPAADATPAPEGAPATDEPPNADGKQGATLPEPTSPFRLAAYQSSPDATAPTTEGEAAEPAADAPTADDKSGETAAEAPATEDKSEADPAEVATPASGEAGAPAADAPAADKDSDKAEEDIVEYEPLEKVSDDIRRTLARDKAVAELQKVMSEAAAELQAEYNAYGTRVVAAKEAKRKAPAAPAKLTDLKWLADKYGLTVDKTASLTDRELFDTAVGKAADVARGSTSVTGAAFMSLELFEPFLAKELEGDWYLVMKVEDEPAHVPEFTKVRDKVIAEWKRREAARLAEKKAKELAEEVKKAGQSFEDFFKGKGYEVIPQTELFSWRSLPVDPMSGYPPTLSEVPKLKNVGPEFMEAAFSLGDAGTAGVLNFDHSTAYVIKLHSRQYTESELKELFLEEDRFWPGQIGTRTQRQQAFAAAVDQEILKDRAGLEFDEEWLKLRQERSQRQQ